MTYIQQAIEKSIEGGYKDDFMRKFDRDTLDHHLNCLGEETIFLDPLFWSSLGKAEGWGSGCNICLKDGIIHSYANGFSDECKNPEKHLTKNHKYPWTIEWHRFIDHLAEQKDPELFFKQLLQ